MSNEKAKEIAAKLLEMAIDADDDDTLGGMVAKILRSASDDVIVAIGGLPECEGCGNPVPFCICDPVHHDD